MRAVFVDASETLADVMERRYGALGVKIKVNRQPSVSPDELPDLLADAEVAIIDHTGFPTRNAMRCPRLKHVIFLGTGARSYMNPEELAENGISVDIIKNYGDTAVAEFTIALMWAAAKGLAPMDRTVRAGNWVRTDGLQLTGKTLGLVGFGSIAAEVARIAVGAGMKVLAWNRSKKTHPGVAFADLDAVLAESHVLSMHLLLNEETRGCLSRERIARMRKGAILINTARGALVDEAAMLDGLKSGRIGHAGLDVFEIEPLPADHPLVSLPNATLTAHSAFRTIEASENLIDAALGHYRRLSGIK